MTDLKRYTADQNKLMIYVFLCVWIQWSNEPGGRRFDSHGK